MWVHIVGVVEAKLLRTLVHLSDKVRQIPGEAIGNSNSSVVAGIEEQPVKQVSQGIGFALLDADDGTIGAQLADIACNGMGDSNVLIEMPLFHGQHRRH